MALIFLMAVTVPAGLGAQISGNGRCAIDGPVFWGQARATALVPALLPGPSSFGPLLDAPGRVSLDCEDGQLVFRQFALVANPVWRQPSQVLFDLAGHPRLVQFLEPNPFPSDHFLILTINSEYGQQKDVQWITTLNLWFIITGVAPDYSDLFTIRPAG